MIMMQTELSGESIWLIFGDTGTAKSKIICVATIAGWTGRIGDHNMDSSKVGKDLKLKVCKHCCRNCLCDFVTRGAAGKPGKKERRRMGQQLEVRRRRVVLRKVIPGIEKSYKNYSRAGESALQP